MTARAPGYVLGGRRFVTKEAVAVAARAIRDGTGIGGAVADEHLPFLLALLAHHDDWVETSAGGVEALVVRRGGEDVDRFHLRRVDGAGIDLSFMQAVQRLPNAERKRSNRADTPARIIRAARTEIADQLVAFKQTLLVPGVVCEVEGEPLLAVNVDVDHRAPATFEKLLSEFCTVRRIELESIATTDADGRSVRFADELLGRAWRSHHREHARLGLMARIGHRRVPVEARRRD